MGEDTYLSAINLALDDKAKEKLSNGEFFRCVFLHFLLGHYVVFAGVIGAGSPIRCVAMMALLS